MLIDLETFHGLFTLCQVPGRWFSFFYLQQRYKFLKSGTSNWGSQEGRFSYIRDVGWDIPTVWSEKVQLRPTARIQEDGR